MAVRSNPYSTELAMLRDYLKAGFDPYEAADQLERFYDEKRGGRVPKWFDANDPQERIVQMSKKDKADFQEWIFGQDLGVMSPPTLHMSYEGMVDRDTWLIHFTNDARKIIKEGIICGHDETYGLHLTSWLKKRDCRPGWNFAFEADSRYARDAGDKYGKDAVMFQSAGVKVYHFGDEEDQVIFQGKDVRGIVPLWGGDGDWVIEDNEDSRLYFRGDLADAVEWVEKNHRQYWKKIAYVTEGR